MALAAQDPTSCSRKVPSLIHYSQRAAALHLDCIAGFGDIPYELVEPILQDCHPETLLRLERSSPALERRTSHIWHSICVRQFPLTSGEEHPEDGDSNTPWRERFFALREAETKRLDEVGSRLRTQRQEAEQQKKYGAVKFTDRVPPVKRPRVSGPSPKTLFQKARAATKYAKVVHTVAPRPKATIIPNNTTARIPLLPPPPAAQKSSSVTASRPPPMNATASSAPSPPRAAPEYPITSPSPAPCSPPTLPAAASGQPEQPTQNRSSPIKKARESMLFMPKNRAYSQLPRQRVNLSD